MNTPFKLKPLAGQVLLALSLLYIQNSLAACVDNGDGTMDCAGSSQITDTTFIGSITLDNSAAPVEFTLKGTDPGIQTGPEPSDLGMLIRMPSTSVGASSIFNFTGTQAATINAEGGSIRLDGTNFDTGEVLRVFDPAGWSNDANGQLLNGGVAVGVAAAITAGPNVSSLTVNAITADPNTYWPATFSFGVPAFLTTSGDFTATIYANNPLLTVNTTEYAAFVSNVWSFAGADYTPPALQDGTQTAVVNSAGLTRIKGFIQGDLYITDKNPLLTKAQEIDPGLVLAYSQQDVGPRDSVIDLKENTSAISGGNVYLGSGKHLIEIQKGQIGGNVFVDQSASMVTEVVAGVANPLYEVHGDRQFTLNLRTDDGSTRIGDVIINDVAGAVNTINYSSPETYVLSQFTANGLGNNTFNYECQYIRNIGFGRDTARVCNFQRGVEGFTNINITGIPKIYGNFSATNDINILSGNTFLTDFSTFTASNINIAAGASFEAPRDYNELIGLDDKFPNAFQTMGDVNGNIINNGTINVGNATLDVNGDVLFKSGSTFIADVGLVATGQINATGSNTFEDNVTFKTNIKPHVLVHNGDNYIVATNFDGFIPTLTNNKSLLQWYLHELSNNLVLRAEIRVPDNLLSKVSPAGLSAFNSFFSYHGQNDVASDLQSVLIRPDISDENVVRIVERLRPEVHDAGLRMMLGSSHRMLGAIDTRLLDTYFAKKQGLTLDEGSTETGALRSAKGLWVLGYGDRASQEAREGLDGYGLSSVGFSAGLDKEFESVDGYTRAGVAIGYARGNASNTGYTVNNRIDMNSFMAAAYASRVWDDVYANVALGVAKHTQDTRRQLIEHSAIGSHDSWQWMLRADLGLPFAFNEQLTLIPMASFDYSHIKEQSYVENGKVTVPVYDYSRPDIGPLPTTTNGVPNFQFLPSAINLHLDSRSFDSYKLGMGGKAIYTLQENTWSADLELNAMLRHEFGDLRQDINAYFLAGGTPFKAKGMQPARDSLNIGGKVNLTTDDENDQLSLVASYDAEVRDKYFGQTVALNARYDFDQAPRYIKAAKSRLAAISAKQNIPNHSVTASEKDISAFNEAMLASSQQSAPDNKTLLSYQQIDAFLKTWIAALTQKNFDLYFNSYASDFEVPDGLTRQQWQRKHKAEISNDAQSNVMRISNLTIEPMGDKGVAVFTATQLIDGKQIVGEKILDLVQRGGRWLIVREDTLSAAD